MGNKEIISAWIDSCHAAIYAYGIIAAFTSGSDKKLALQCMSDYRHLRNELIDTAESSGIAIPAARSAYELPKRITTKTDAHAVAATIEAKFAVLFSDSASELKDELRTLAASHAQSAAARYFHWTQLIPTYLHA